MKIIKFISCALLAASLIVVLFCVSIIIPTFSVTYYMNQFRQFNIPEYMGISESDIRIVTENLQRYMDRRDPELDAEVRVHGIMRPFFNQREILHMEDVRDLFDAGFRYLWISCFVFVVMAALIIKNKNYYSAAKHIAVGFGIILASFGILTVVIALNFDEAFVIFHEIFFDNDLWLLDPRTDLLINLLPIEFFINISRTIATLFIGSISFLFVLCTAITIKFRRRERIFI